MRYYEILGVEKTATQTEIKKAYMLLAKKVGLVAEPHDEKRHFDADCGLS